MTLRIKGATTIKGLTTVGFGPPLTVSGLQIWLDASDASTITTATGVSQWRDKSGNGNHASQSTGSAQPTVQTAAQNGLNTIRFTAASSQKFTLASLINLSATGYTFLGVLRRGGPTGLGMLPVFTNSSNSSIYAPEWYVDGSVYTTGTALQINVAAPGLAGGAYNQISTSMVLAGTSGSIYFNGSSQSVLLSNNASAIMQFNQIGQSSDGYANGEIAEIMLYNSVLSTNDRQKVEAYLKAKWATP